jgi:hypothetical protein
MKYTQDEMMAMYRIYASPTFNTKSLFIGKLKSYGVPEKNAALIWKSFDVATDTCWRYMKLMFPAENSIEQ